jgi:hypothetical protein
VLCTKGRGLTTVAYKFGFLCSPVLPSWRCWHQRFPSYFEGMAPTVGLVTHWPLACFDHEVVAIVRVELPIDEPAGSKSPAAIMG